MITRLSPRKPAIGFIIVTLIVDAIGIGLGVPVFPLLVQKIAGIGPEAAAPWVGLFVASYAAMQFLFGPLLGALSDRFGRRPVLILSIAGLGVANVLLAVAPSLWWVFASRLAAGATGANISTCTAYIADVTPPAQRAARFGLTGAAFGLGFVIGPAIGGFLGAWDLRLPFIAAACLSALNLLYGLLILPESLAPENRRRFSWRGANVVGSLAMVRRDPVLGRLGLAWCGVQFAFAALPSTFVLFTALRLGWRSQDVGFALAFVGLAQALVQGVLARSLIPRLGERRAGIAGLALTALAYLVLCVATEAWMVYVSSALLAAGSLAGPAIRALMSATGGSTRQGEIAGAVTSLEGLTAIFSPFAATALFAWFSGAAAPVFFPGAAFLATAVACVLAAWLVAGTQPPAALAAAHPA